MWSPSIETSSGISLKFLTQNIMKIVKSQLRKGVRRVSSGTKGKAGMIINSLAFTLRIPSKDGVPCLLQQTIYLCTISNNTTLVLQTGKRLNWFTFKQLVNFLAIQSPSISNPRLPIWLLSGWRRTTPAVRKVVIRAIWLGVLDGS